MVLISPAGFFSRTICAAVYANVQAPKTDDVESQYVTNCCQKLNSYLLETEAVIV